MRYYLDCEFNGMGGELISLGLVREDDLALYLHQAPDAFLEPWVAENVWPLVRDWPSSQVIAGRLTEQFCGVRMWPKIIEEFLRRDTDVTIITDWPDDIKYFCELIITGPGTMIEVRPSIKFEMHRVDAYPTALPGAIQHNAYWDAMALRHKLQGAA